jgi:hypothetical protein
MGGPQTPVQADETYYGNTSKRAKHYRKGHSQKAQVLALVEPSTGRVRAFKVKKATADKVRTILFTNVRRNSADLRERIQPCVGSPARDIRPVHIELLELPGRLL